MMGYCLLRTTITGRRDYRRTWQDPDDGSQDLSAYLLPGELC